MIIIPPSVPSTPSPPPSPPPSLSPTPPVTPPRALYRCQRNDSYISLPTATAPTATTFAIAAATSQTAAASTATTPAATAPATTASVASQLEPSVDEIIRVMRFLQLNAAMPVRLPPNTMSDQLVGALHNAGALMLAPPPIRTAPSSPNPGTVPSTPAPRGPRAEPIAPTRSVLTSVTSTPTRALLPSPVLTPVAVAAPIETAASVTPRAVTALRAAAASHTPPTTMPTVPGAPSGLTLAAPARRAAATTAPQAAADDDRRDHYVNEGIPTVLEQYDFSYNKLYVVTYGRSTGIFRSWGTAGPLVNGYNRAVHKSFTAAGGAWEMWVSANINGELRGSLHRDSLVGIVRDGTRQAPPPYEA